MSPRHLLKRIEPIRFELALVGSFLVLNVLYMLPVSLHPATLLSNGVTDPLHTAWIFSWQVHSLHNPIRMLRSPPYYFPFHWALALNEQMFGGAMLAAPAWLLTHNPVLVVNSVMFATFPIAGFGVFLLIRDITGSRWAAVPASLAYAFGMYRLTFTPVLHVALIMWIPYVLFFLRRFLRSRSWKDAAGLSLSLWLQLVSSGHGIVMLAVCTVLWIGPVLLVAERHRLRDKQLWQRGAAAIAVFGVLSIPFVVPYVHVDLQHPEFHRGPSELALYSGGARALVNAPERSIIYGRDPLIGDRKLPIIPGLRAPLCDGPGPCPPLSVSTDALFPGFALLLAATTSVAAFRKRHRDLRVWAILFAGLTLLCAVLSTGSDAKLHTPYGVLYRLVPGLNTIRVPGRFTPVTTLGLAGLVGIGFAALASGGRLASPRRRMWAALALSLLLLLDVVPHPFINPVRRPSVPHVYARVASASDPSPILELPTAQIQSPGLMWSETLNRETFYLSNQMTHWRPILNGFGGNQPPTYFAMAMAEKDFPDTKSLQYLWSVNTHCVIVHRSLTWRTPWDNVERVLSGSPAVVYESRGEIVVDVSRLPQWPGRRRMHPCLGPPT